MYEDQVMNVTDDNGEKFKENIYFYHMLVVFDLRGLMRDWVCLHNMRQIYCSLSKWNSIQIPGLPIPRYDLFIYVYFNNFILNG